MKPIETRYKGYNFRSRLEARWAVYLSALRYKWEYEPEGFVLKDGTHYLPDFRIAMVDTNGDSWCFWFEVKPKDGSADKAKKFADELPDSGNVMILLDGAPEPNRPYKGLMHGELWMLHGFRDRPAYLDSMDLHDMFDYGLAYDDTFAVECALSARFEHGESPCV